MSEAAARGSLGRRIVRDTAGASLASIASQGLSLLIAAYCAAVFGATLETDAYNLAYALPLFAANVVREAIKMVFVPVLVEIRVRSPEEAGPAAASALTVVAALAAALALLVGLVAPLVLPRVAAQMPERGLRLALVLLWESLPALPLLCLTGVLSGLLNAYRRFSWPMLVVGVEALVRGAIVYALAGPLGIHGLALANVLAALSGVLWLWWGTWKEGLRPALTLRLHPALVKMGRLAWLPLVGNSLLLLNPFVDRAVATRLETGSVTALGYAERINSLPWALIGASLFTVILSHWSELVAKEGQNGLVHALRESLPALAFILAPLSMLFAVLRYPLVRLILERGHFTIRATEMTSLALGFMALGIVPYYIAGLLARAYLALQDTRTPVVLGIVNACLNLGLDLALVGPLGLGGIALSSALTLTIVAMLSGLVLGRRLKGLKFCSLAWPLLRILLAAMAGAAAAASCYGAWQRAIGDGGLLRLAAGLAAAGAAGLGAYVMAALALRLRQPKQLLGWLQHRGAEVVAG